MLCKYYYHSSSSYYYSSLLLWSLLLLLLSLQHSYYGFLWIPMIKDESPGPSLARFGLELRMRHGRRGPRCVGSILPATFLRSHGCGKPVVLSMVNGWRENLQETNGLLLLIIRYLGFSSRIFRKPIQWLVIIQSLFALDLGLGRVEPGIMAIYTTFSCGKLHNWPYPLVI